jgi:ribosomal small subunit protein bTHX
MGKGDKKTAKGKRTMGSYGNSRRRKVSHSIGSSQQEEVITATKKSKN